MKLAGVSFHHGELYSFNLSVNFFQNVSEFLSDILPPILNLFTGSGNGLIALLFGLLCLGTLARLKNQLIDYSFFRFEGVRKFLGFAPIFALLIAFALTTAPGLVGSGGPPTFFRAWHPSMAIIVVVLIAGLNSLGKKRFINSGCYLFLIAGVMFAVINSYTVASTLASQLQNSESQYASQLRKDRWRYIVVEARPPLDWRGLRGWGVFKFIHVLTIGILNYILHKLTGDPVAYNSKKLEWIVADKKNSKVLLEKNILDGAIPGKVRVASSQVFDKRHVLLFDSNQHSGFQLGDEPQKVRVSFSKPEKVICYSITFRSEDRTNFRIPKHKFQAESPSVATIIKCFQGGVCANFWHQTKI